MEKLLKSEVCEAREQYTGVLFTAEKSKHAVKKKKKKTQHRSTNAYSKLCCPSGSTSVEVDWCADEQPRVLEFQPNKLVKLKW